MAENFASAKENGTAYYAVAVVKKNSGISINSLKVRASCDGMISPLLTS